MNCVFIRFNAKDDLPLARSATATSTSTSAGRKFLGTNDDLFVRNDIPLVEEAGDPLVENLAVYDELTKDETVQYKFGYKESSFLQNAKREKL